MPSYRTASFEVKLENLAAAKMAIAEFVATVNQKERGTRLYLSLESLDEPRKFLHVMAFEDAEAEERHRATAHVEKFTEILYPLTVAGVQFYSWAPVGMDAPGRTRRSQHKVVKRPQRKAAKKKLAARVKVKAKARRR